MIEDVLKIILPATIAFVIGILCTPFVTNFLYKHKMWKKKAGKRDTNGNDTPIFNSLHKEKEVGTPRMGGLVVGLSVFITLVGLWVLAILFNNVFSDLDLISRSQTWIPFALFIIGAMVGMVDDLMEIRGSTDNHAGGLSSSKRLAIASILGAICGYWFYVKLGVTTISFPILGVIEVGVWLIPIYAFIMASVYASGVIDGLDGLSGGVFAVAFAAYSVIAYYQDQVDLAGFSAVITGAILAFLWFNIPPARFYMTEVGMMALTLSLTVVAFMTDTIADGYGVTVLPIIALPLVLTLLSVVIQKLSKKLRNGKKVFLVAPIHHHFEAIGWPAYKVTMRYWIVAVISGFIGIIIALTLPI